MSELVKRLSEGQHPVIVCLRPAPSIDALRRRIDDGYVHIKFTDTRGGTELGVTLDRTRTRLDEADFEHELGTVTLVGTLMLDWVNVRCSATVSLPTLEGEGALEIMAPPSA